MAEEKKKGGKGKFLLLGLAAATIYSVATGKGPFNKYRFKEQHEEIGKYLETNYPDCIYSPITFHGTGWSVTVMRLGKVVKFIYFTKDEAGHYIFTELDEKMD